MGALNLNIAAVIGGFAIAMSIAVTARAQAGLTPTFRADVQPILRAKCATCHQQDGDAPFSLETFEQVRRRASMIVRVTSRGFMPPWKPAADSPAFLGDRRLSDADKSILKRWAESGTPEGDAAAESVSAVTSTSSTWRWGTPDLVIALPEYTLPAGSKDVFRNFVVPVPFSGTRYVRAFQFRPRSLAVHHANIRVDITSASADLDASDPAPGYEGAILHSAQYPAGEFLGWTPGQATAPDEQIAWTLHSGSSFVAQLHMRSTGRDELVTPLLGLYFADGPPSHTPAMIRLGKQDLSIPAGANQWQSVDTFVLPVSAEVLAIQPHSHYRARDVVLLAERPDGRVQTLLHIDDWDAYWQDRYRLQHPIRLPPGTTLRSVYTFDNSASNPRNPYQPPADAAWGWRTSDEMADVWLQVRCDTESDRQRLTTLALRKATEEDAIGAEVLVARQPDHFNLRNDAALIYEELNLPQKVLEHFEAARRLRPAIASTALNVGTALESLMRLDEAAAAYRDAAQRDPSYALARVRLGALLYRQGRLAEALTEYAQALRLSPDDAAIRCERARVLVEADQPFAARTEYLKALEVDPNNVACLINATWLFAAHQNAEIRSPAEAVTLGQLATVHTSGIEAASAALDALAAAFAAANRYDEAVATAIKAQEMATLPRQRQEILERLSLYRRRLPFRASDRPK